MKTLIIYFVTALVSYVATIPPGPLSVYIVHTTLQRNIKIALWIALGGVLGEMGYTYLAIEGVMVFDKYPIAVFWAQWIIIVLLLIAGFITFFQKGEVIPPEKVELKGRFLSTFKGITLSLLTPALFPFWVVVLLEYKKYKILTISTFWDKTLFVAGAETGTFLLVYTYAYITERKRNTIFKYLTDNRLNKLMGCIYIGLAVWQLINMI